ncbi:hypothetical protein PsorP6_005617 [Peronosclerospora sorghi]|uniref:Uncharacterized protein n=1 Tax=Peronosclerospora sorghi TaxID=230839 RepID=A0ACC0W508_9STRA|nr:hypothetical protein PsorP6_005617 [Peronosclerospora sorghi]
MESKDDEETGGAELLSKTLSIFHQQEADGENISGYYEVQRSKLFYATKQEAKIGEVGNISDGKVASYIRIVCAANLHVFRKYCMLFGPFRLPLIVESRATNGM